jgi:hypothetical protein
MAMLNEEVAAIGRFMIDCILRSGTGSITITRGFRDKPRRLEWYAATTTAAVPPKQVMCTGPELGEVLQRLLDRLR